jgi:hypothetical protein
LMELTWLEVLEAAVIPWRCTCFEDWRWFIVLPVPVDPIDWLNWLRLERAEFKLPFELDNEVDVVVTGRLLWGDVVGELELIEWLLELGDKEWEDEQRDEWFERDVSCWSMTTWVADEDDEELELLKTGSFLIPFEIGLDEEGDNDDDDEFVNLGSRLIPFTVAIVVVDVVVIESSSSGVVEGHGDASSTSTCNPACKS